MQHVSRVVVLLLVWGVTITCARITVNVYFPAAEIRDAASRIEREVRQEDGAATTPAAPAPAEPGRQPQGSRFGLPRWHVRLHLGVPAAMAQSIDINVSTPAIRQLVAARKQRYPRLVPLFEQGVIGENNQGLLEIRSLQGLALREQAQARSLVQQENQNRQQLYQTIATANNIPPEKVSDIGRIFAEVNRKEAKAGWQVQLPSGAWTKP